MKHRTEYIFYFVALTGIIVLALVWTPSDDGLTLCPSQNLFGVSCPGCGLSRSVAALAKGDLQASMGYHALGPLFFAAILAMWGWLGWCFLKDRRLPPIRTFHVPALVLTVSLTGYWIIRALTGTLP